MTQMRDHAADYAEAGYAVFPLSGKIPAIPTAHPDGDPLQGVCKGECGRDGHGVLDATTDVGTIYRWWQERPRSNVGCRVPRGLMVLDVDPRSGGRERLAELEAEHGRLPATRTSYSGRGDGGRHLWWKHPGGKPSSSKLGKGLDIKTWSGYVVLPPSVHPDSGKPYTWATPAVDPAEMPDWLRTLVVPPPPPAVPIRPPRLSGPTVADALSWAQILQGWMCLSPDPDADGAKWRHPAATSPVSATIRHNCLFVYSTNTPFEVTEAAYPHGYTKLRAYATLYHNGDCKAAHRALRGVA